MLGFLPAGARSTVRVGWLLCIALVCLLSTSAQATASTKYVPAGQFGSAGNGNGQFSGPTGVALDQSTGDVYVLDAGHNRVEQFSASGTYLSQFNGSGTPSGAFSSPGGIAVDSSGDPLDPSNEDVYVVDDGHDVVDKFSSTGTYLGQLTGNSTGPFTDALEVAVDLAGNVSVYDQLGEELAEVDKYNSAGQYISGFHVESGGSRGMALDSNDNLYAILGYPFVDELGSTGSEVGLVDRCGCATGVAVDQVSNDVYVDRGSSIVEYGPSGQRSEAPIQQFGSESLSAGSGLAVASADGEVYVADSASNSIAIFHPVVIPDAVTEPASNELASTAQVNGTVNPDGTPLSVCEFEYGTEASYGQSVPCAQTAGQIGAGESPVAVSAALTGLQPRTPYHFRLVVGNVNGTTREALDETLTTHGPPTVGVGSASNIGSSGAQVNVVINAQGAATVYRIEYGSSSAYGSSTPEVSLGAPQGDQPVTALLSGLQPDATYHFRALAVNENGTTPGADATFSTYPLEGTALPDDRSYEMVSPLAAADGNVYEPQLGLGGNIPNGDSTMRPFRAAADGSAIAYVGDPASSGGSGSEGTGFGNQYLSRRVAAGQWSARNIEPSSANIAEEANYQDFSSDLSTGILDWNGRAPLSAGAPTGGYPILYTRSLPGGSYQSFFNTVPPNREPSAFGAYKVFHHGEGSLVYAGANRGTSAVAADSHLLFEANDALVAGALDGGETQNNLYDSVNGQLRLVNILPEGGSEPDATFGAPVEPGAQLTENPPNFSHVISADGARVFWTQLNGEGQSKAIYVREDGQRTRQVDAAVGGGGRFWTASPDGSKVLFTKGDLYEYDVDSGQTTDLTPGGEVVGVVGAGEDLTYVYFVAKAALAPGATAQTCEEESSTAGCNLYVLHAGKPLALVTVLAGADRHFRNGGGTPDIGDWQPGAGDRTATVTPDGRHLALLSGRALLPNMAGGRNVYLYDGESGRLTCVSCSVGASGAAQVPTSYSETYVPRWLSEDGARVFFDSAAALVPQDTNGQVDVYEWEQQGSGSCRRAAGCIYLLSQGTSNASSLFADASVSGDDAFIVTRAQLVPQDRNEVFDLYDARADAPQPVSPPACSGAGCQGVPPAAPIFATPSSATFNGVGNFAAPARAPVKPRPKSLARAQKLAKALKACDTRSNRHRRKSCEALARKRYGTKTKAKQSDRRSK